MMKRDTLLLKLLGFLEDKQIESTAIEKSFELLCNAFSFDFALLYEIEQDKQFCLKERFGYGNDCPKETLSKEKVLAEYDHRIVNESITYLNQTKTKSEKGLELLEFFSASALVIFPIDILKSQLQSILVFSKTASTASLSQEELSDFSFVLSVFRRYLVERVYQKKLIFSETLLECLLDNSGIDIYVNDFYTHEILYVNKSMAAPYGGIDQFLGNQCWSVLFPGQTGPCDFCPQKKLIDQNGNPTKTYSWDYQRPFDGAWFRVFSSAFRWIDGRMAHMVSSADISENKRNEEIIQYMANYDSLTGLPNRRMLVKECDRRINNVKPGETGYLMFFDIDGFKRINDTLGHDAGDEFLIKLGAFFSGMPMLKNAIYRNGGDEFVAILDGALIEANIRNLTNFIHERFKKPWDLAKGTISCNISVGVASYPEDGATAEILLNKADQAMYKVKQSGGKGILFAYEL